MILTVLGAVSELERSYINERTRKGVRAYIAKGGKMGPKRDSKKIKRDKMILSLAAAGNHSWVEIAEEVGCSKQTVYGTETNKAKEHREADMTSYYEKAGKQPGEKKATSAAKTSVEREKNDDEGLSREATTASLPEGTLNFIFKIQTAQLAVFFIS